MVQISPWYEKARREPSAFNDGKRTNGGSAATCRQKMEHKKYKFVVIIYFIMKWRLINLLVRYYFQGIIVMDI